jgi:hypothetical protein
MDGWMDGWRDGWMNGSKEAKIHSDDLSELTKGQETAKAFQPASSWVNAVPNAHIPRDQTL